MDWKHHYRIFVCCNLSIFVFLAGMAIIVECSLLATTPQFYLNNTSLPQMRPLMDDLKT